MLARLVGDANSERERLSCNRHAGLQRFGDEHHRDDFDVQLGVRGDHHAVRPGRLHLDSQRHDRHAFYFIGFHHLLRWQQRRPHPVIRQWPKLAGQKLAASVLKDAVDADVREVSARPVADQRAVRFHVVFDRAGVAIERDLQRVGRDQQVVGGLDRNIVALVILAEQSHLHDEGPDVLVPILDRIVEGPARVLERRKRILSCQVKPGRPLRCIAVDHRVVVGSRLDAEFRRQLGERHRAHIGRRVHKLQVLAHCRNAITAELRLDCGVDLRIREVQRAQCAIGQLYGGVVAVHRPHLEDHFQRVWRCTIYQVSHQRLRLVDIGRVSVPVNPARRSRIGPGQRHVRLNQGFAERDRVAQELVHDHVARVAGIVGIGDGDFVDDLAAA